MLLCIKPCSKISRLWNIDLWAFSFVSCYLVSFSSLQSKPPPRWYWLLGSTTGISNVRVPRNRSVLIGILTRTHHRTAASTAADEVVQTHIHPFYLSAQLPTMSRSSLTYKAVKLYEQYHELTIARRAKGLSMDDKLKSNELNLYFLFLNGCQKSIQEH